MQSHDNGITYMAADKAERKDMHERQLKIADIAEAMSNGFKAEPDLSPCHLPLLSTEALERVHAESEKWRKSSRERELEQQLQDMINAEHEMSDYYLAIRGIIHALDMPAHFRSIDGSPAHIAWTEQKARELVKKADDSERNRKAAENAESRVDLLGRYVKACDEKRLPYNWNVFKLPNAALRQTVYAAEGTERLTNCDTDADRVNYLATRKAQETEQSLRWHVKRHEAVRKLIHRMNNNGEIRVEAASELMDTLLDRPQTGEQTEGWTTWEWGYAPKSLTRDTKLELRLKSGDVVILDSSVVEWDDVEAYRPAK